ncbi:hypothetical protein [Maribacter sp. HTCC2170]|uniref:hypothetical protein n=1 Tax=Maribacter sp. (strain HTCC2170 / KCCM 42371) TaxID=313603 RepID=UPI00006B48DE|nr:hypothetical protein [Maribacter sp. HTCC2170]EAR00935.1 hypothetical protein FB2170_09196 [Maribacter sp. HTCC2170]
MRKSPIYIGDKTSSFKELKVTGELINLDGENYYKITNSDAMRPFFMSIVSDSNHWMFLSSNGGLTAGRKDSDHALFPYYTDDKITESAEITGSKTILQIHKENKSYLWEPFSDKYAGIYKITRNLYKNSYGNKVIFEELNKDLGLTFRYQWNSSNKFGFVKKSSLINNSSGQINATIIDGIQNILPYGVTTEMQNTRSNLVDAYKKNELEIDSGVGIYALSAIIVDKAEPSEALKSTIAWSAGINVQEFLISSLQLNAFRRGKPIESEIDIKAEKGAYFIKTELQLGSGSNKNWLIIANVNQTISAISEISEIIKTEKKPIELVQRDIDSGTNHLLELTDAADGQQLSADKQRNTRHFSNTLFNIMRGGIFDNNYQIEKVDFTKYIVKANKQVAKRQSQLVSNLPNIFTLPELKELIKQNEDVDFKRLCFEYMPLKFSRRHGDPSRPWNKFSINTRSEIDGSKILDYEGNWRDIFQNWEALAHSYPEFIESMIHKFLNATTFEGYNPYRVTKDGFDWEVIEENDPWSYIGYWGDHQIIYLLKFLEFIENHYPNKLISYFNQELFVYANVPYKIKSYSDTLNNPKDTIDFDTNLDELLSHRKKEIGADGALITSKDQSIYYVNLIEKLLVTLLAKTSNFIPEGGIWLNTQRPEWNDANNALVGNGVSMVTLYYLRRFINFLEELVTNDSIEETTISVELSTFFNDVVSTFDRYQHVLNSEITNKDRKTILDGLGNAASSYRSSIYKKGFEDKKKVVHKNKLIHFFNISKKFLDHTIKANKRGDKMYHSYNLMTIDNEKEVSVSHLNEMLEGQVAILSSGYLNSEEALELLDGLKNSSLFRTDQYSYLLYPNKELTRFKEKNNIPLDDVKNSQLLKKLLEDENKQIIEKDQSGGFHFNGNFNNAGSLINALSQLDQKEYGLLITNERQKLLEVFEMVFDHKSFTGRSGTFFGYEGLGSIYWHMVSKLVLAVQEICLKAMSENEDPITIGKLLDHYYEINEGIGVHKSPELYGAFPTDPYSHTPSGKGAQQPGMTGQVKEDILSRFGELGVFVKKGKLQFRPVLLRKEEFLRKGKTFKYNNVLQKTKEIVVEKESLCFTYCQVPVVYKRSVKNQIILVNTNSSTEIVSGLTLTEDLSRQIFERNNTIEQIQVEVVLD